MRAHGFGGGLILLALAPGIGAAIGVILIVAATASLVDVVSQSMTQRCVPDRLRDRAMGAWMLAVGINPLGQLRTGALAAGIGADAALALNGFALVCCAITVTLMAPRMLRL